MTVTAVYDSNTKENWPGPPGWADAYRNWLMAHGINPNVTHRVEHHLIDCPLIRVYQYDRVANGKFYLVPGSVDEVAQRPPYDVLITSDPPRPEDYR